MKYIEIASSPERPSQTAKNGTAAKFEAFKSAVSEYLLLISFVFETYFGLCLQIRTFFYK